MKIITSTKSPHRDLVAGLYSAVDNLDADGVGSFVAPGVTFRMGNFDELHGRQQVIDANAAFFRTIAAMRHTIMGLWSQGQTAICSGTVHYTRMDETEMEVPFATVLTLTGGLIADYRVYVDVSNL